MPDATKYFSTSLVSGFAQKEIQWMCVPAAHLEVSGRGSGMSSGNDRPQLAH